MRWKSGRRSANVQDRRGTRVSRQAAGGGIVTLVILVAALYFGIDPQPLLETASQVGGGVNREPYTPSAEENELADFTAVVLGDTEDTWHALFRATGSTYEEPQLVLFSGAVQSACGFAQAATGPFYCPGDRHVYIDLGFFRELQERFRAPGDFAQAYVIAHEVGHHVQTVMGISQQVRDAQRRADRQEQLALSVRMELQADCFAGLWAHHAHAARNILEAGDVEEGLNAAAAIGDDRIQKRTQGYVVPESFSHGSSEQRVRWFRHGLENGRLENCDTFAARKL